MIIEITMEKTQRVAKEFEVTDEQLKQLKDGVNPFLNQLELELESGDCKYDYAVNDEEGRTLVNWN